MSFNPWRMYLRSEAPLWEGQRGLLLVGLVLHSQVLAGAGDGETFLVKQFLDAQHAFDVLVAVHALAGAALDRLQVGELGFPEAQDVGR